MRPRIAVIGAGAVGGYVGGLLAKAGQDVTLIDPWPEHIMAIRANGLELEGVTPEESCTVQVDALHLTELQSVWKQRPVDIAIVAVKSYDTEWATMMIRQYLAEGGYVVSLQNCLNEERIAGIVGWGRTVGCIAALLAAELHAPGRIRRTVAKGGQEHTVFRLGEVHGRITARIEALGAMLAEVDSVRLTKNLWGERWSKLCVNGMRNGVSAVTGFGGNDRERHDAVRRFTIRLGGEAVRIGQALGYDIEPIAKINPERLARASEGDVQALEEVEAILLAGSNTAERSDLQRPSMAQDIAKGRRTEIDFMNGYIVEQGKRIGRAAPAHVALVEAVKRLERGEMAQGPESLPVL
ncbi:MAG: 2-dehydropantoate 2-reductase [Acetobacteraceae bacterium]